MTFVEPQGNPDFRMDEPRTATNYVDAQGNPRVRVTGQARNTHGPCERFVGKREWGLFAEPWRGCVECSWPKAQHELGPCKSMLMIKGESFPCDVGIPHDGWAHGNSKAEAMWVEDATKATLGQRN